MKSLKLIIPLVLLMFLALYLLNRIPNQAITIDTTNSILIFTSPTCPHCQTVKDHISQAHLQDKLPIELLDLSQNQAYSALLTEKAKICQLTSKEIGIPFYFYKDTCLQGDQPIIDALNQMLQ